MSEGAVRYRLSSGEWQVLIPSIYALFPASAWEQMLMALCLWGGSEAVVSHRAAAQLWCLDGVAGRVLEITLARSRRSTVSGAVIHVASNFIAADIHSIGPLRATSVTRTLIDLGSVDPPAVVEEALDCALRRRLTSIPRLQWRLGAIGTRGRKGAAILRDLLVDRFAATSVTESPLEVRLGRLLRTSNLPSPRIQHEVVANGRVVARCDYAYPDVRLAIEADGYAFHSGKVSWQRDLSRRSSLAALGWRVIHVTDDDLRHRRDEVVAKIRAALGGDQETFLL